MKYRELIRKLSKRGIEYYRDAKGSHEIWWDPATGRRTTIPRHPGKEIKK
ncbi:MAG: type II toxin-antitoxin system HicA family toxin [Anaerolineae bacterium]